MVRRGRVRARGRLGGTRTRATRACAAGRSFHGGRGIGGRLKRATGVGDGGEDLQGICQVFGVEDTVALFADISVLARTAGGVCGGGGGCRGRRVSSRDTLLEGEGEKRDFN